MRRLIAALFATALLATTLLLSTATASNGGGSQICVYFYNPVAGNYIVFTESYGQYKQNPYNEPPFGGKQYTTDRPPASCENGGIYYP